MGIAKTNPALPLEAYESTFATLFKHLRNGVAHCRMVFEGDTPVDWIYLHVNDAFSKHTGLTAVTGRRASELIPGLRELDPELFAIYGRVVTTGEATEFERYVKALDLWFVVSAYRARPGEFVAVFEIVSERKRAEAALRASEARFRAVFEQAAIGIAQMDASGGFLRANPKLCAMLGYEEADLVRLSYREITHPDHAESDRALHQQLLEDPAHSLTFEKRLLRKDGGVLWADVTISRAEGPEPFFIAVLEDISARKLAEARQRESEARLRLLVEHAPAAIALFDREMRYLAVSRRYAEDLQLGDQRLIGRSHYEVFPDLPERWRAVHARCLAGASEHAEEDRFTRADGRVDFLRWAMHPWRDDQGEIGGLVLFSEFVTKQHQAAAELAELNAALRSSERELRTTFDLAPIGIAEADPKTGRWRRVNRRICEITGYSAEELQALSITEDVTHPDDRPKSREWFEQVNAGQGLPTHLEKRYVRKDGSIAWVEIDVAILRDDAGVTTGTLAAIEDVTEKRRAEARLRAVQARYRDLVDNLEDVVFTVDAEGALTFINRAVSRFGYDPSTLVGVPIADLLWPEDRPVFAELLRVGTGSLPRELRLYDVDGKVRYVRATLRRKSAAEQRVGMAGVLVDLTTQREVEAQLRASQKMEAIGRLAGGVAHDFNNLLSVILSYTELTLESLPPGGQMAGDLGEVMKAGLRAEGLTRQLLAFSRRQVLDPRAVDLNALVAGLGGMLTRLIGEDVELTVALGEAVHTVKADPGQLEQVLMNLVVNARDAMPRGGKLHIGTRNVRLDLESALPLALPVGSYVELTVADSGCGMSEATRSQIFEPFFTTKSRGKGTGLGLAMVYGIARQSGGAVAVESVLGEGSVFRLYLPSCADSAPLPLPAIALRQAGNGTETILVVDDEPALRSVVARVLSASGYDVRVASTPAEALAIGERDGAQIGLVLTDVIMPGMNGRELAERLVPLCPTAKFMFMSGYTDDLLEQHGVLGAEFLRKPFDWRTLALRVRGVLDGPSNGSRFA